MNILIVNPIVYTSETKNIIRANSINHLNQKIKKNIHSKLYGENVSLNQFLCHIVFLICIIYQNT